MSTSTPSPLGTYIPWHPIPHTVIKDQELKEEIHRIGWKVIKLFSPEEIDRLLDLYTQEHTLKADQGGMFYSVYSQDFDYRRRIHEGIGEVMTEAFHRYFHDFQNVINFFVTKLPGPASEFSIHQDMTSLDEYRYSPLSIWTPLQEIGPNNGALCVLSKSHAFFSPYRGISFPFPFAGISEVIREYLQPIYLKKGEALVFDNRILHSSLPNHSSSERVAIVSGIFPQEAKIRSCYRSSEDNNAPIEVFEQEADYLLKNPNFLVDCHSRPVTGTVVETVAFDYSPIDESTFRAMCQQAGLRPLFELPDSLEQPCQMLGDPVSKAVKSLTLIEKFKALFK